MTPVEPVENHCRRYEGRIAIVTGAAQGLGRWVALRLAQEGAQVALADLNAGGARRTAEEIASSTGQETLVFGGDLSVPGLADALAKEVVERFGRIDTLVNNAAALIRMRLVDFTEELMQQAVAGNVWTTLRMCKAVVPAMTAQRYGRIVNVAGEAWRIGTPFHTLLGGVGKGSMIGLTATLAGELAGEGVTVNCVSPGGILTDPDAPPAARDSSWNPPEVMEELGKIVGTRAVGIARLAHPSEVAAAIAFFGSPEARYVTGQHLGVSGGRAML